MSGKKKQRQWYLLKERDKEITESYKYFKIFLPYSNKKGKEMSKLNLVKLMT